MTLTRFPEGSLRELFKIALPLMISSLSVVAMIFVDRMLLANYSTEALNAAVNAMTLGWGPIFAWMTLGSIAEVYVAQFNGAGDKQKIGSAVWQMIWLSLFSILFFLPIGLWGGDWLYGTQSNHLLEKEYFTWMMVFGPTIPFYAALCGFFIGQGKTHLVTIVALIANVLNAALDGAMIFGVEGWLEPMGVKGAAIATTGSSIFQALVLAVVFLNARNRSECGTNRYQLRLPFLWQMIKIGLPGALFVGIELMGWAAYYSMMTEASDRHITIAGISQSVVILFFFFADGIGKAASTIAGNFIGAGKFALIPKVMWAGVKLHFVFFISCLFIFFCFADLVTHQFLPFADAETLATLEESIKICLLAMCFYLLFEGLRMLISGVLTAAGDTLFLLIGGSLSVWILLVLPVYLIVIKGENTVEVATLICVVYSVLAALFYYLRFWQGKWKSISII
jgi:MATE family multidrug resistance protein